MRCIRPSAIVIPDGHPLRRIPPRPTELRQPGYLAAFDDQTIFYDIFHTGSGIFLSGPPLLNLQPVLSESVWRIDGEQISALELRDWDRSQRSWLHVSEGGELTIEGSVFNASTTIGEDYAHLFEDKYTIVALSKNNELHWIQEWLQYYHEMHGVTAVVIYDNASTNYTTNQLLDAIACVEGIDTGIVVDWSFKFGPGPGPAVMWDSRYLQICAIEHAHWRFLRRAAGVINADIDELVLADDRRPVFEHAQKTRSGLLQYQGRWIEMATERRLRPTRRRRYQDYRRYDPTSEPTTAKWTLIPSMMPDTAQWRLHGVAGVAPTWSDQVMHRHFKGINTNWRYDYQESVANVFELTIDEDIDRALVGIFAKRDASGRGRSWSTSLQSRVRRVARGRVSADD